MRKIMIVLGVKFCGWTDLVVCIKVFLLAQTLIFQYIYGHMDLSITNSYYNTVVVCFMEVWEVPMEQLELMHHIQPIDHSNRLVYASGHN